MEKQPGRRRFLKNGAVLAGMALGAVRTEGSEAREAEEALDGPEKAELQKAEAIGKGHSAGEDPKVKGKNQNRNATK